MAVRKQFRVPAALKNRAGAARWKLQKPVAEMVRDVVNDYAEGLEVTLTPAEEFDAEVATRIPDDVLALAEQRAAREGTTLAAVVRAGLDQLVTTAEQQK